MQTQFFYKSMAGSKFDTLKLNAIIYGHHRF
jgi:hypothetical protein